MKKVLAVLGRLKPSHVRSALTSLGFATFVAGVAGSWGMCIAMQVGGGIVFGLGVFGMVRR